MLRRLILQCPTLDGNEIWPGPDFGVVKAGSRPSVALRSGVGSVAFFIFFA
jgi:hypothetical protein